MAGSNATTRGVPRRILQGDGPSVPVIGAGSIPTIQYSTGAARALQQFSRDLFSLSDQFEDQLDAQAEAEASSAGALAGASGDFQIQNYGTIRGRAFNKAAVETFTATLDTNSVLKLSELQQKHWNDPGGLQAAWDNYRVGVRQELAKVSPEQAAAFDNRSAIRGLPAIEQAKDTAYKLTRSQADAALVENEAALRAEIKNNAGDLLSDNPDRSRAAAKAIGQVQADYMNIYRAKDPTTGKPLYTPEEIAVAKKAFSDMVGTQSTLGWFDEQQDKAGAYLKFVSGDFKIKISANNDQVPLVMANRGATRNDPLKPEIQNAMKAAAAATGDGIGIVVHSGGQETAQEVAAGSGSRTGSTRHDHGGAGDLRLTRNGQVLDFNQNRDLYVKFAENAAAAGLTGIGVDEAKGYIHAGGGSQASWGYRGKSNSNSFLSEDFKQAIERGRANPMDATPSSTEIAITDMLSPTALNSLDAEMRQRMTFMNTMADRQAEQTKALLSATQAKNAFDFTARVYAAGATDPGTGQPVRVLTREDVIGAVNNGTLKPGDGEAIMKALTQEQPEVSDDSTFRDLQRRVYSGEDIFRQIIDAGSKLSKKDAASLLSLNQSQVRGQQGEFSADQKFYFNTLSDRLRGGAGPLASLDQGRADRSAQALDEYRRRVMDPNNTESPSTIADDIALRATRDMVGMDNSALDRKVAPRYSVPKADNPARLDLQASAKSLFAAFQSKKITQQQFEIEQQRLVEWGRLQTSIDKATAATKGK